MGIGLLCLNLSLLSSNILQFIHLFKKLEVNQCMEVASKTNNFGDGQPFSYQSIFYKDCSSVLTVFDILSVVP